MSAASHGALTIQVLTAERSCKSDRGELATLQAELTKVVVLAQDRLGDLPILELSTRVSAAFSALDGLIEAIAKLPAPQQIALAAPLRRWRLARLNIRNRVSGGKLRGGR